MSVLFKFCFAVSFISYQFYLSFIFCALWCVFLSWPMSAIAHNATGDYFTTRALVCRAQLFKMSKRKGNEHFRNYKAKIAKMRIWVRRNQGYIRWNPLQARRQFFFFFAGGCDPTRRRTK